MPIHHINLKPQKRYFKINEVSKLLNVTNLTLRNWDKAGKLKAYRNPINNYRLYKPEDIELFIRKLESVGKIRLG
jgi:DNA (cytosine-5)-methyltransferase 1